MCQGLWAQQPQWEQRLMVGSARLELMSCREGQARKAQDRQDAVVRPALG